MKITFLCSDVLHPVNAWLDAWISLNREKHEITVARRVSELTSGELLFLISCSEILPQAQRDKFQMSLVLHASDLPKGRGWSPHIWSILQGDTELTLTLLEVADPFDTGRIVQKEKIPIEKTDLWNEINEKLFDAEIRLIDHAIENFDGLSPQEQDTSVQTTYFRRRNSSDSELNINDTIAAQFDLLRVCDPSRYPAYFEIHGQKYKVVLEKIDE